MHWYFVERTDFVPVGPFVSCVYDERPGYDGNPVGELYDERQPRKGTIPQGAGIARSRKGSDEQWGGAINLADRTLPSATCAPELSRCRVSTMAQVIIDPCQSFYKFAPHLVCGPPPTITFAGVTKTMYAGPDVMLEEDGCSAFPNFPPALLPLSCPDSPAIPYWTVAFRVPQGDFAGSHMYLAFYYGSTLGGPNLQCVGGGMVAGYGFYYGPQVSPPCNMNAQASGFSIDNLTTDGGGMVGAAIAQQWDFSIPVPLVFPAVGLSGSLSIQGVEV